MNQVQLVKNSPAVGTVREAVRPHTNRLVAARLARHGAHPIAEELAYVRGFDWLGLQFEPLYQVDSELLRFLEHVRGVRTIVEIGSAGGGTAFLLARVAAADAVIVCIDLPGGPFGGRSDPNRSLLWRSFALPGQLVTLVEADSRDPGIVRDVGLVVPPVDMLFIDGDHSSPELDWDLYRPLVRPGGMVAFHDIVPGPEHAVGRVPEFWQQIRGETYTEIVADWNQGGYGFGVLTV